MDQELEKKEVVASSENIEEVEAENNEAEALEQETKTEQVENVNDVSIDEMLADKKEVIEKESDDTKYDEIVEQARIDINNKYRKSRMKSNISMAISFVLIVGAFVLIMIKNGLCNIIGYALGGATLVGMIVYYFINKSKFPNEVKDYIKVVVNALNGHVFKHGDYQELTTDPSDKLDVTDFLSEGVYKEMTRLSSRNVVNGTYLKRSFKVADVALGTQIKKQQKNIFVGKYINYMNDLHFEGRYVVVSRNEDETKRVDVPNNIDDLEVLEESESFAIYGPKGSNYKEDLGTKFISMLKSIKLSEELLGFTVVIWAGHSAAYLSYTDAIIALPFERPFSKEAYDRYTSQQLELLNALNALVK